jgi:hypothetical protein
MERTFPYDEQALWQKLDHTYYNRVKREASDETMHWLQHQELCWAYRDKFRF